MPTVLWINGWRVVIYPNDHAPAHVHVKGPGWEVVVNILNMEVREVINIDRRTVNSVVRQLTPHQDALLAEWRRIHGH